MASFEFLLTLNLAKAFATSFEDACRLIAIERRLRIFGGFSGGDGGVFVRCERDSCDLDCSFDLDCVGNLGSLPLRRADNDDEPWLRRAVDNDEEGGGQNGSVERLWESDGLESDGLGCVRTSSGGMGSGNGAGSSATETGSARRSRMRERTTRSELAA